MAVGLLAGTLAFTGLAAGASPYASVALVLLATAFVAQRAYGTARRILPSPDGELEQVTRALVTVEEAIAALPGPDFSAVLHTIALQAQSLTGAQYVALGFGNDPDKPFDPWINLGMGSDVARFLGRYPRPVGTLGRVACGGDVVRTRDVQSHPSFQGFPTGHPKMASFLGVPIKYRGRPAGNLYLANKRGAAEFSEHDERVVGMLAARAAVAIEAAKLYTGEAQRHEWLRTIIDQMPEGVLLLDGEGRTLAANRALQAFLCEPRAAPTGLTVSSKSLDVRSPDGVRVLFEDAPSERALRHGEVTMGRELVVGLGDGRLVPILASAAPVRDEKGQIAGATLIVQDITDMKDVERLREEWTSVVAHDLRQPVSIIALAAEGIGRLHSGEVPEREGKALAKIRTAAQRLNRMIDDLLDASRLESKRMAVECRSVDLGALLKTVIEDIRDIVAGHDVRLVAECRELTCWIDAGRIQQVLGNLISNAAKYGAGKDIRVGALGHDNVVEVTVSNDGPGISAELLPNLFHRFTRSSEARAGRAPGLGLGLYIAKGLIEAHRGRIWVESTPDGSTTFHFTVPKTAPPREPTESDR
jgi:signal transduction histidine kinase